MDFTLEPSHLPANRTRLGWVNEPEGRGTLGILIPCTGTLLLCSWTVMHLNIPKKHSSLVQKLLPYCYWCIIGIFGPELVIWAAWRQLLSAHGLREHFDNKPLHEFTNMHGFYALMGGYAFDLNQPFDHGEPAFVTGVSRLSLTPLGVKLLADCGVLPAVSKEEIKDRSKVDELGRFVTVLQASWMVVQVIVRLTLHLPITLLEVTVLGHVFCALVVYALWWDKPLRVEEPTRLTGEWVRPLLALMIMVSWSETATYPMLPAFKFDNTRQSEISTIKISSSSNDGMIHMTDERFDQYHSKSFEATSRARSTTDSAAPRADIGCEDNSKSILSEIDSERKRIDRTRRELACAALQEFPAARRLLRGPIDPANRKYQLALDRDPGMPTCCRRIDIEQAEDSRHSPWTECRPEQLVTLRANDWPNDGLIGAASGRALAVALWAASVTFSAIHLAAWNTAFPSEVERWLWRSSALYVGFSGLFWASLHSLSEVNARIWWLWYDYMSGEAPKVVSIPVTVLCCICGIAYVLARAYLIIEGYAELRSLPSEAFLVPRWTLSVPHIA